MQWYFAKKGVQSGPVSLEDLRSKLASGELRFSDMVWSDGMSDWKPASEIVELTSAPTFGGAPPIPVSPGVFTAAAYPMGQQGRSSGLATASIICGIFSLLGLIFCFGGVVGVAAVICGHLALAEIKKSGDTLKGYGKAIAGLVMGYVSLLLMLLGLILFSLFVTLMKSSDLGKQFREQIRLQQEADRAAIEDVKRELEWVPEPKEPPIVEPGVEAYD